MRPMSSGKVRYPDAVALIAANDLEPARQEDDRAEEAEADQEGREQRRHVGAVAPEVERDDRLLGPRLGHKEDREQDGSDGDQTADLGSVHSWMVSRVDLLVRPMSSR